MVTLTLTDVQQVFAGRKIFGPLNYVLEPGRITVITGVNGSGKSTFLRLAGKFLVPTKGKVIAMDEQKGELKQADYRQHLAMVTPELRFYPRLTAWENLEFLLGLRGIKLTKEKFSALLARVGLEEKNIQHTFVGEFSTGMRQRLKLAVLLASASDVWLLDEPSANLDAAGRILVAQEAKQAANRGTLVLWATNDKREEAMADAVIDLGRR